LNFISTDCPSYVEFETSIAFAKIELLMFQMNGQGKFFKKITLQIPLFRNTKKIIIFLMLLISRRA
jgi:hypothetical protein